MLIIPAISVCGPLMSAILFSSPQRLNGKLEACRFCSGGGGGFLSFFFPNSQNESIFSDVISKYGSKFNLATGYARRHSVLWYRYIDDAEL